MPRLSWHRTPAKASRISARLGRDGLTFPPRSRSLPRRFRLGRKWDERRLVRPSRARFHDHDRRPALHAPVGRSRRRGDQDRGAGRRHDAHPAAVAQRRQHQLRPAQRRQEEHRPRSQIACGGRGGPPAGRHRRRRRREFPAGGHAPLRARLRGAQGRSSPSSSTARSRATARPALRPSCRPMRR